MTQSFLSLVLALLITIASPLIASPSAWAISSSSSPKTLAVFPGLQGIFAGTTPTNLGVKEGKLASCPTTPNCVVSQEEDKEHQIAPLTYTRDLETARQVLLKVLPVVPGAVIVEQNENYIRVEYTSKLLGFVDDGEFYFPPEEKVIQVRSASRLGESDLGVNRRRLEQIRLALQDLGV